MFILGYIFFIDESWSQIHKLTRALVWMCISHLTHDSQSVYTRYCAAAWKILDKRQIRGLLYGCSRMENSWQETDQEICQIKNVSCVKRKMKHLITCFLNCKQSNEVWNTIRNWLGMRKIMGSFTAVLKAYRTTFRGNSILAKMRCAALASCIYHIWNARNRAIFENEKMNTEDIFWKTKCIIFRCLPGSLEFNWYYWVIVVCYLALYSYLLEMSSQFVS